MVAPMRATGLVAALLAAVCFNAGAALQAAEARRAPVEKSRRLALLVLLARRPRWVLGIATAAAGVAFQLYAFHHASFVVVQATLAAGLLVLLGAGAAFLGEAVSRREVAAVCAMGAGIALVAWGAPRHAEAHRTDGAILVVAALALVAAVPFARRSRPQPGAVVAACAGFAVAASNIATKAMSDGLAGARAGSWLPWLLAAGATAVVGLLANTSALQRSPATRVVPISFAVQTFLPIVLGPLFLLERWGTARLGGAPLAAGLLLVLGGVAIVASRPAVGVAVHAPSP